MTLFEQALSEIKRRAEAAMPGPWTVDGYDIVALKAPVLSRGNVRIVVGNPDYMTEESEVFICHSRVDIPKLLNALEIAVEALQRVNRIRTLPLTDMHDTDEERASQYSSVLDTLVYIASEALTKIEAIMTDKADE